MNSPNVLPFPNLLCSISESFPNASVNISLHLSKSLDLLRPRWQALLVDAVIGSPRQNENARAKDNDEEREAKALFCFIQFNKGLDETFDYWVKTVLLAEREESSSFKKSEEDRFLLARQSLSVDCQHVFALELERKLIKRELEIEIFYFVIFKHF